MTAPTAGTVHVTLATFPAHTTEQPPVPPLSPEQGLDGQRDAPGAPTAPQANTSPNRKDHQ